MAARTSSRAARRAGQPQEDRDHQKNHQAAVGDDDGADALLLLQREELANNRETAPVAPRVLGVGVGGGYGLAGMHERLRLVGGSLMAGPIPNGWSVHAEVPG